MLYQIVILCFLFRNIVNPCSIDTSSHILEYSVLNHGEFIINSTVQISLKNYILYEYFHLGKKIALSSNICKINKCTYIKYVAILLLTLGGDIQLNPGPIKNPCGICQKSVKCNQRSINCDICNTWFHAVSRCILLTSKEYSAW